MGIKAGLSRVVLSGNLPGGEIWNTGFWMDNMPTDLADAKTKAEAIFALFGMNTAGHTAYEWTRNWAYSEAGIVACTVYGYGDHSGHATLVGRSQFNGAAGVSTSKLPDQTAICLSLRTPFINRSARGRMYFPAVGATILSGSLFDASKMQAFVNAVAADLSGVVGAWGGGFHPGVYSQKLEQFNQIIQVTADQRPDTQRRRANRQARGNTYSATVT